MCFCLNVSAMKLPVNAGAPARRTKSTSASWGSGPSESLRGPDVAQMKNDASVASGSRSKAEAPREEQCVGVRSPTTREPDDRDGRALYVQAANRIKLSTNNDDMAHPSCVGETTQVETARESVCLSSRKNLTLRRTGLLVTSGDDGVKPPQHRGAVIHSPLVEPAAEAFLCSQAACAINV